MKQVMLAATLKDTKTVQFPVLVSPKLDGIRAIVLDRGDGPRVYSRTMKLLPNRFIQQTFGKEEYLGLDGELVLGLPTDPECFRKTASAVMSQDGEPSGIRFYIFDLATHSGPFQERYSYIWNKYLTTKLGEIEVVPHTLVQNEEQLLSLEQSYLSDGCEGAMIRSLNGPYKQNRSTVKEGFLLKLKRFNDADAVIIGYEEKMRNENTATLDERGYTKRSSAQDGKVGSGTLGALIVRDLKTSVEFSIGTGFNDELRDSLWHHRDNGLVGQVIKYKYFEVGAYDKPRFPVFLGFRPKEDVL